jgi:hypothetical protein
MKNKTYFRHITFTNEQKFQRPFKCWGDNQKELDQDALRRYYAAQGGGKGPIADNIVYCLN